MAKIIAHQDNIISASIPVYFFQVKDDSYVYAECPSLDITTYGDTLREAKDMFKDAFKLWKEAVNEDYSLKKVLEGLGWKLTKTAIFPKTNKYKEPRYLLESDQINLQLIA